MNRQPPDPTVTAARWLVDQNLMGVVMLDGNGRVVGSHGALVDWVEPGGLWVDRLPFLKTHECALEKLQRGLPTDLRISDVPCRDAEGRELSCTVNGFSTPELPGVALVFQAATRLGEPEQGYPPRHGDLARAGRPPDRASEPGDTAREAKSVFLANFSHELRTPLNVIIGNGEILRDWDPARQPAEDLRTFAEDILENGAFLLDHINDLLDLAKAEAGGITVVEEPVDLDEVIADALAIIGQPADGRAVSLDHRRQPGPPRLIGDPRRLQQVMQNLLGHAVTCTPDGGTVSVRSFVDKEGRATIEVQGDGGGSPPDRQDSTMQPVGRAAAPVDKRPQSANGGGLPLAKMLIEMHDGTLTLDSVPGEGARAILRFPANRTQVEA